MNDNTDFEQLDALLAQPATLADKGFSQHMEMRFRKFQSTRRNIFLIMGIIWLALVFAVTSPQAIFADYSTFLMSLDIGSIYSYALDQLNSISDSAQILPYPTIAAGALSVAAIVSLVVRV